MPTTYSSEAERYIERIVEEVSSWEAIQAGPHRFGGTEFALGPREVGHVHRWGIVDINFPKRMRDALIEEGKTGEHHVVPDSGWTTFYTETESDVETGVWLLRLSYLYQALTLRKSPAGRRVLEGIDIGAEVGDMDLSDAIQAIFDDVSERD